MIGASRLLARRPLPGRHATGPGHEVGRRWAEEMPEEPHVGFRVLIHLSVLDGAEERRALVGPDRHPRQPGLQDNQVEQQAPLAVGQWNCVAVCQ